MTTQEEHKLREEAEARVGFKAHVRNYFIDGCYGIYYEHNMEDSTDVGQFIQL